MFVKTNIRPDDITQKHTLFVEGSDLNSIDPQILSELLGDQPIRVSHMGSSFSIKSVAQAMLKNHPNYYFLIDRDHHADSFVDQCWSNFSTNINQNLLIWRRREIENYFLDPDYLIKSKYCTFDRPGLEDQILNISRKRLFLDAANQVIISIREDFKNTWVEKFTNIHDFSNKDSALNKLKTLDNFSKYSDKVRSCISPTEIERRFYEYLSLMTGGSEAIQFGAGKWLGMIKGKEVFSQIANICFKVEDREGISLTGSDKTNAIVKDLLKKDINSQPVDFKILKQIISDKITNAS